METAKEKAIREAYGEHWKNLTTESKHCALLNNGLINTLLEGFPNNIEPENKNVLMMRPKSLSCIETNNGWQRIESEADLPVKNSECWVVWKLNGFITTDTFKQSDDKEYAAEQRKYWMEKYSHHQPKIKPQPPIY